VCGQVLTEKQQQEKEANSFFKALKKAAGECAGLRKELIAAEVLHREASVSSLKVSGEALRADVKILEKMTLKAASLESVIAKHEECKERFEKAGCVFLVFF
jgi:hypothetical protein